MIRSVRKYCVRIVKPTAYLVTSLLLAMQLPSPLAFAVTNTLYVTPSSSQMNIGTSFTVNIKAFTDTNASTMSVSGIVTYPSNLLQVSGTSTTGSDFGNPTISTGNGSINFSGTRASGQSSLSQIFSITFQAKGAGTANVGFDSSSTINGGSTTYKTGSFTITNPSPPPQASTPPASTAPTPVVSTAPSPTPTPTDTSPSQTDTTTVDPTGVVSNASTTALYNSATVTWQVNASNPSATLSYGSSSTQLDKQGTVQKTGAATFSASLTGLVPGEQYYFSISGNGTGAQTGTYSGTFSTQGYPITITVTENNVAAANAQIQIGANTYTTHSDGKVTIGLAAGNYSGTITTSTATLSINLTVAEKTISNDGSAPEAQTASFNLTSSALSSGPGSTTTILTFIAVLVVGSIILVFGVLIFINYRRRRFDTSDTYSISKSSSVIIDDGYTWQQDDTPAQPAAPTAQPVAPAEQQHNGVYLNEEEPLDMFEQARLADEANAAHDAAGQSPNSPRSTTP